MTTADSPKNGPKSGSIDRPVAVVTGANSGIGRATALHLAERGYRVFGTVRGLEKAAKLVAKASESGSTIDLVEVDVANDDSVRNGFADILRAVPHIDVLVNNAGIGGNGVTEECNAESFHNSFNVNVVGTVRCLQQVLPGMRARRSGTIVNVTSILGRLATIAQAPYLASKWALEGVSEALAQELAAFNIRVAIIEPGVTKSSIFHKNIDAPNATGAYNDHYERMFKFYAAGITNASDATEVALVIHHAITTDQPQLRYPCSWGGETLLAGRAKMSDTQFVAMGEVDNDTYFAQFRDLLGLDLG